MSVMLLLGVLRINKGFDLTLWFSLLITLRPPDPGQGCGWRSRERRYFMALLCLVVWCAWSFVIHTGIDGRMEKQCLVPTDTSHPIVYPG